MSPRKSKSTLDIGTVLFCLARNPCRHLLRRWNWKAACLSACSRGAVVLMVNLTAGLAAAFGALLAEACYRSLTAGFYGALNQSFRYVRPVWVGSVASAFMVPVLGDGMEFILHSARGTPRLSATVAASVAVTMISTVFELFAMRRGILIVGKNSPSLSDDLKRLPGVIAMSFDEGWRCIRGKKLPPKLKPPERCEVQGLP